VKRKWQKLDRRGGDMARFGKTLKHAWNVFSNQERKRNSPWPVQPGSEVESYGTAYGSRPDRVSLRIPSSRTIISSIYTRLSIDVASIDMRHIKTDAENRYLKDMDSGLNTCLTVEANLDQAARAFRQDVAMTLLDRGVAALVPVDTSISPEKSGGFEILTMRVGDIVTWYPNHVRVNVYNEAIAKRQEITLEKKAVAIVENPLYSVMNEPNSTLQRLLTKLELLDLIDSQTASKQLDLIIQLPYVIKSEARRQQAEQRRKDIEFQLKSSEYGIAYTDGTEKITQLNRPAENNLMGQIEYLTAMLYGQLGLTEEVMNGTADEKAMLNYWNRTIEPILTAMVESMRRTFLTKTARTQRQTIQFFRDPFRLVPIENIAEIADKFTRNEIMTSNEMRQVVGMAPHPDPKADQLLNSNMPQGSPTPTGVVPIEEPPIGVVPESDPVVALVEKVTGASVPILGKDVQNGSR
jgi:putative sterol carrier protein